MTNLTKAYYIGCLLFGFILLRVLFFSSIEHNAGAPSFAVKSIVSKVSPQGWGFFTRNPREPIYTLYEIEGHNKPLRKVLQVNSHASNLFGFSRKSRRLGMEVSIMVALADSLNFRKYQGVDNLQYPDTIITIDNSNLHYLKSGDYVLIKRKIVPFSWASFVEDSQIPYSSMRVKPISHENMAADLQ